MNAAALFIFKYCVSVRPEREEYNNYELGHTKQQEFSLKVSSERERTWRRVAGFRPGACLMGESASLSRAVCGRPEDESL